MTVTKHSEGRDRGGWPEPGAGEVSVEKSRLIQIGKQVMGSCGRDSRGAQSQQEKRHRRSAIFGQRGRR